MTPEATVTIVIPGRDCAGTVAACLEAALAVRAPDGMAQAVAEIIFVDDGSTDATPEIVARYPVTYVRGEGRGAGAARNLGWRRAKTPLVWFLDADCVARPDALTRLLPHLDDPQVSGVGGSYDNMCPDSLVACLIHEEIRERHLRMPTEVDHVATFNVVYRTELLRRLDGFDERYLKGQDLELSFRALREGYRLHFEDRSRVGHFHETGLARYLAVQRQQGYWRVFLHSSHRGHAATNAYSDALDHLQPPVAMFVLATAPLTVVPGLSWLPLTSLLALVLAQFPLTSRLASRLGRARYLSFVPFGVLRAFWRGVGMTQAVIDLALGRRDLASR